MGGLTSTERRQVAEECMRLDLLSEHALCGFMVLT